MFCDSCLHQTVVTFLPRNINRGFPPSYSSSSVVCSFEHAGVTVNTKHVFRINLVPTQKIILGVFTPHLPLAGLSQRWHIIISEQLHVELLVGKIGVGTEFYPSPPLFLSKEHSTNAPHSFICHRNDFYLLTRLLHNTFTGVPITPKELLSKLFGISHLSPYHHRQFTACVTDGFLKWVQKTLRKICIEKVM